MTCTIAAQSALSIGEVHVWVISLNDAHYTTDRFLPILSQEERTRAESLYLESDRVCFIRAHGIVRQILASYSDVAASSLKFRANRFGKPFLVTDSGAPNIQFSVSHSGEFCLLALRLDCPVGIDLEKLRNVPDIKRISDRYFTSSEAGFLSTLCGQPQRNAFFALWTHKEAMVKGLGLSLAANLRQIEFDFNSSHRPRLVSWARNTSITKEWSLRPLSPGPDYVAAVACKGPVRSFAVRQWPDDADVS